MKLWASLLVCLVVAALCSSADAEEFYPFSGRIDFQNQVLNVTVGHQDHQASLGVQRQPDRSYELDISFNNFQVMLFDMTTHLKGVVRFEKDALSSGKMSGRIIRTDGGDFPVNNGSNLEFELTDGQFRVNRFVWDGLQGAGCASIHPPYALDFRLSVEEMDVIRFISWVSGAKKNVRGPAKVNADVALTGTLSKIFVKANISSRQGAIENFSWDLLSLHVQGIYPVIEIANSTITKTNGLSFDLDGVFDLSQKESMGAQLKAIRKIPLVKENALQSQWVLKRVEDSQGEGKTETKFFLKKDKRNSLSDQDDSGLLGVEKKIGF